MDRGAWQATVHGVIKSDTTAVTEHARTWREITSFHIFATVNRATINIVVQILYGHDLVTKQQQHFTGIISILKPKLQSSYSCFMDEESNSVICLSLHSKQCMWMWIQIYLTPKPAHLITMLQYLLAEKAMAPHSSTLAWKILWTKESSRLQSMGSLRVRHD